jgi:hypothetical protein
MIHEAYRYGMNVMSELTRAYLDLLRQLISTEAFSHGKLFLITQNHNIIDRNYFTGL